MNDIYDIIIIGGGPAGLSAAIYGGRAKLNTLLIEKGALGGMAFTTREMVNYPGFKETTGPDLCKAMADHAKSFGAEIVKDEVKEVELDGDIKTIKTKKGKIFQSRSVILAMGSHSRMLNIPGEKKLRGNGVSYCATCDAGFYEDLEVIVVGNGDAAIEEAMYITKFANKVTIVVIHEEGVLDCNKLSAEKVYNNPKIHFIWDSALSEIKGEDDVNGVVVRNLKTGELTDVKTDGVFIFVGMIPGTDFLHDKIDLDKRGFVKANEFLETSVDGVYVAGDTRVKYLRQVVTAAGDGATAAVACERYLEEEEEFQNLLDANKPLLIAFWNPNHEGCLDFISTLEKAVTQISDKLLIMIIDISRKKTIANKYGIKKESAAILLKEGKVVWTAPDDISTINIIEELDPFLRKESVATV